MKLKAQQQIRAQERKWSVGVDFRRNDIWMSLKRLEAVIQTGMRNLGNLVREVKDIQQMYYNEVIDEITNGMKNVKVETQYLSPKERRQLECN
ncbi:MAG: hypothetical protein ACRC31_04905, partial [Cetobacterium sp.]